MTPKPDPLDVLRPPVVPEESSEVISAPISPTPAILDSFDATSQEALEAITLDRIAQYFDSIEFIDGEVDSSQLAQAFDTALAGREGDTHNLNPIQFDLARQFEALADPQNIDKQVDNIFPLSMGGTSVKAAKASFSMKKGVSLEDYYTASVKEGDEVVHCKTEAEFWDRLAPAEYIQAIGKSVNSGEDVIVPITLGLPITTDGRIVHFADKISCPALAPFNASDAETQAGSYPAVTESFANYLKSKGIDLAPQNIVLCPNDTIAVGFADVSKVAELSAKGLKAGAIINGTGFNIALGDINTESGHNTAFSPSSLDQEICELQTPPGTPNFEALVSGKLMDKTFKLAVSKLFEANPKISEIVNSLELAHVFELSYDQNLPEINGIKAEELKDLQKIAQQFTARSARYVATLLHGLQEGSGADAAFIVEGSLLLHNPAYVAEINSLHKQLSGKSHDVLITATTPVQNNTDQPGISLDNSILGTIGFGAAASLAA